MESSARDFNVQKSGEALLSLFFRYVPAARRFLLNEVTPVPLRSRRTENIVERFFNGEWSWLTRYLGCLAELFYMFDLGFAGCFKFAE
ncbi:TPA: hypothetical protein ACRNCK_002680 [Pseudomonas aeruginosa]|uniref:hypothetical protein n=1 Tax=Pseudomonas aeruginosa TaxID=287 RepID=UPI001572F13A|nr:hypothetical protein [Pseudomonas aeruginosa]NTT92605.1 hypothetical protein [Pseudomonas aeruginosa]HCF3155391.1 hypothetical protein [Pseudomonas aeruginosa]HDR2972343.1 hypothetical protein [Pseudomonas aeruginosa]